MKYLLIASAEALTEPMVQLAEYAGVAIEPGSSGLGVAILPPFELVADYSEDKLTQTLKLAAMAYEPGLARLGELRCHPQGAKETWIISAGFLPEHEQWLMWVANHCHKAVQPYLAESLTCDPPYLRLVKGLSEAESVRLLDQLEPKYRQCHFQFPVDALSLLKREAKSQPWEEIAVLKLPKFPC